jgi:hypothetical protein
MQQTLHKAKCARGTKNARKAMRETVNKTHKKQEGARKSFARKLGDFNKEIIINGKCFRNCKKI